MNHLLTNILNATDGSPDALLAGRATVDLAQATGTGLHVLHAWHPIPPNARPSVGYAFDPRPYEENARELLAEQRASIEGMRGEIGGEHLRAGPPADEILKAAEELEAGLIVIEGVLNREAGYLAVVGSPENTRMRNLQMDLHLPESSRYPTYGDDHTVSRTGAPSAKERTKIGFGYRVDRP